MNDFFAALGTRLSRTASRRGARIEPPALAPDVAAELLDLARVAAHMKERQVAPLSCFLAGIAVERLRAAGKDQAIADFVREVREDLERDPIA